LKEILTCFGIEEERLRLTWIGASDGLQFADTIKQMVAQVRQLGPTEMKTETGMAGNW